MSLIRTLQLLKDVLGLDTFTIYNHLMSFKTKVSFSFPLIMSLGPIDIWFIIFTGCLSLFMTRLVFIIPIYLIFKIRRRAPSLKTYKFKTPKEMAEIISLIKANRLENLTKAIERNPSILHCDYKKQTLLSWCKFYNNTSALMLVLQLIKKYPPEKVLSMAS